jgi:O-antigen/teichoic acid export membrane protein
MAGLAVTAKPLVEVLLTGKWLPCVPYLIVSCCIFAFYPVHTANLQSIAAMGRSDILLKMQTVKIPLGLAALAISVICFDTPFAVMLGQLFIVPIGCAVNAFPNSRLLSYPIKEQIADILPTLLISCAMGAVVYAITFLGLGNVATLALQVPAGLLLYLALAKIFKIEALQYAVSLVVPHFKKAVEKIKRGEAF